jgi:hypothetical protein
VWSARLDASNAKASAVAAPPGSGLSKETSGWAYGVAVDGTSLFWSDRNQGRIKRRALATLTADLPAETVADAVRPKKIALDADRVYWVTESGQVQVRQKNGLGTTVTLAQDQENPISIVVDDRYVYWTNGVLGGDVRRMLKTGSGSVETIAKAQALPNGLTQDCTAIYWTNQNDYRTGQVVKVVK